MYLGFALENEWLSSFASDTPLLYKGTTYCSVVQAYECQKCANRVDAEHIMTLKSYDAHKFGQTVERVPNWSESKYTELLKILYARYSEPSLRECLLSTGHDMLLCTSCNSKFGDWAYNLYEEHTSPMDANYFGKLTMYVRFLLQSGFKPSYVNKAMLNLVIPNMLSKQDMEEVQNVLNRRRLC